MRASCVVSVLGLVLAAPALAQPSDPARAVGDLVARVRTSGDLFAFLAALGRLGDVDLDRAALAQAVARASGPAKDLLGSTNHLTARGGRVELQRDGETRGALPGSGHFAARPRVSYQVDPSGSLTSVSGLDVGPRAEALRPVRRVALDRDASGAVASVTAGQDGREATARLRVSPGLAPAAEAAEPPRPAVSTPGLAGILDGVALGELDLSRYAMGSKRYKRRAGSRTADVGVRTLPAITVDGRTSRPLGFESGMAIDTDGAGGAHRGDRHGQPRTSLAWSHQPGRERYLDPTETPFVALPIGFERDHPGVRLGDIVAVQYGGKTAYAIYGDRGPSSQLGEGSVALGKALGLTSRQLDPNRGGVDEGVTYVVFPGSGTGRPLSNAEIQARGERLHRAMLEAMARGAGAR